MVLRKLFGKEGSRNEHVQGCLTSRSGMSLLVAMRQRLESGLDPMISARVSGM